MKVRDIKRDVQTMTKGSSFKLAEGHEKIVFDMFTSHVYSDPIGSVVREIVSNAVDANEEAGQTNPVIVTLDQDKDGNYYFKVQDEGIGISPKKFREIYSVYFNSDKRQSNSQIGGWGIGGKTPLAYTESFELTSIYNGTQTSYLIYRGEDSPDWIVLGQEETELHNGTTIKIHIKNYSDYQSFSSACKEQLCYFKNVYFKGDRISFLNKSTIYTGKAFKKSTHSANKLHAIVGPVQYRLNMDKLSKEADSLFPYGRAYSYATIGLKFEIGEVDVTVSRETLNYTDQTIKNIRKRYAQAIKELKNIHSNMMKNVATFNEAKKVYSQKRKVRLGKDDYIYVDFPEITGDEISFPNYKLDCLGIYKDTDILHFVSGNFVQIGSVKWRSNKPSQKDILQQENHYIIEGSRRNDTKLNAYLKQKHDNEYHHFTYLKEFEDFSEEELGMFNKNYDGKFNKTLFNEIKKEFINYCVNEGSAKLYNKCEVPEEWTPVSDDNVIKMKTVKGRSYYDKTIENLKNLRGRYFYAKRDQNELVDRCIRACGRKNIPIRSYSWDRKGYNFNIFYVSKKNYKILNSVNFDKVHPITEFDRIIGHRRFLQEYEDSVKKYAATLLRNNGYSGIEEFENGHGIERSKEALQQFGVYNDLLGIPDAIRETIGSVDYGKYVSIDADMKKLVKQEGTQLYRRLMIMHGDKFDTALNFKKVKRVLKLSELSDLIENGDKLSEKLVECVKNNL